jgi:hypothetical protein
MKEETKQDIIDWAKDKLPVDFSKLDVTKINQKEIRKILSGHAVETAKVIQKPE